MDDVYPASTDAAEAARTAFANGQQSRQAEIDQLREALQTVRALLNSSRRYKARDARLYLNQLKVLQNVILSNT